MFENLVIYGDGVDAYLFRIDKGFWQ